MIVVKVKYSIFKISIKIFLAELVCLLCRRDQQMKRMEMKVMMMKWKIWRMTITRYN